MKRIDAFIGPQRLDALRAALERLGVEAATLREVKSYGRRPPQRLVYRGFAYSQEVTSQIELSMVVEDQLLERVLAVVEASGGPGEMLVTSVDAVYRFGQPKPAAAVARVEAPVRGLGVAVPVHFAAARS